MFFTKALKNAICSMRYTYTHYDKSIHIYIKYYTMPIYSAM